jgi:hypothetical protein
MKLTIIYTICLVVIFCFCVPEKQRRKFQPTTDNNVLWCALVKLDLDTSSVKYEPTFAYEDFLNCRLDKNYKWQIFSHYFGGGAFLQKHHLLIDDSAVYMHDCSKRTVRVMSQKNFNELNILIPKIEKGKYLHFCALNSTVDEKSSFIVCQNNDIILDFNCYSSHTNMKIEDKIKIKYTYNLLDYLNKLKN